MPNSQLIRVDPNFKKELDNLKRVYGRMTYPKLINNIVLPIVIRERQRKENRRFKTFIQISFIVLSAFNFSLWFIILGAYAR